MQYKDYATWESEQLSGPLSDRYKKFWIEYLKDRSPSLDLPLDFARSFVRKGEGSMYHFSLTPAHTAEIGQIGARYGGSKFIVCFAMLQILLYRYTGQQDFIIGTPSTLRNRPELEDQIGYYVNLLPLRCKVNGSDSFDALLHRSGQLLTTVQDHQVFPFQRILDAAGVTQIPGRQPLFDLLFTYEHELRRKPSENVQTKVKSMGVHMPNSKYDIEFILKEMDETIVGMISYDTSLFREDTIARIADHFIQLADAITLQLTVDRFSFESRSPALPKVALENMDFNI
jgi:non-ribosomal peptide synthetase component F